MPAYTGRNGIFQEAVRRGGTALTFHALHGSGISTVLFLAAREMSNCNITPLHMKIYILLRRASFRLRYEEWKREQKINSQAEATAALETEQLRNPYQAECLILPPENLQ